MPTERSLETLNFAYSLLLSTISSIAFIRRFFPESSFKDTLSPIRVRSGHPGVQFKTLERGISSQADQLLDAIVFNTGEGDNLTHI